MPYEVFKLHFLGGGGSNAPDHVGLYVATGNETGKLFHAINDVPNCTRNTIAMKFENKNFTPKTSASILGEKTKKIETIANNKMDSLLEVCQAFSKVERPRRRGEPNCVTWLQKVTQELARQEIVQFESSYSIPEGELNLIVK